MSLLYPLTRVTFGKFQQESLRCEVAAKPCQLIDWLQGI